MTPIPQNYAELRRQFPLAAVLIGYSGLELDSIAEIPASQRGYSIVPGGIDPEWKPSWLVVGRETSMGDPVFIDVGEVDLPVYTAFHGQGSWGPILIAPSSGIFFAILGKLAALAKDRENPVRMEENPITEMEKNLFLGFLEEFFTDAVPTFWTILLETAKE